MNLHVFRHQILSLACLPIPPPGRGRPGNLGKRSGQGKPSYRWRTREEEKAVPFGNRAGTHPSGRGNPTGFPGIVSERRHLLPDHTPRIETARRLAPPPSRINSADFHVYAHIFHRTSACPSCAPTRQPPSWSPKIIRTKYPSKSTFDLMLEEIARFNLGHGPRVFDLPSNLLRPTDRGR